MSARAVEIEWQPVADAQSGVSGYLVRRDGGLISGSLSRAARLVDFAPPAGGTAAFTVTAVNGAGLESAPSAPLEVMVPPWRAAGGWRLPPGGLDYFYDARPGEAAYMPQREQAGALDGSWVRARTDDWDGTPPGEEDGAPGGAAILEVGGAEPGGGPAAPVSVLSLEDPDSPSSTHPPPNNQRIYLLHPAGDGTLLDAGVTIVARFRVNPAPVDLAGPKGQAPESQSQRGQIGLSQRAAASDQGFSMWLDLDRLSITGGPSVPVARMTDFQSAWVTIEAEQGRHRVKVYLANGDEPSRPVLDEFVDLPLVGVDSTLGGNYLQMGLANRAEPGAIQVDYAGFRKGVHVPQPAGGPDEPFRRADTVTDGRIALDDAIAILHHLFGGEARILCPDAADADDSGTVDITDAVFILRYVFQRGAPPPSPFPSCGLDTTPGAVLGCGGISCE